MYNISKTSDITVNGNIYKISYTYTPPEKIANTYSVPTIKIKKIHYIQCIVDLKIEGDVLSKSIISIDVNDIFNDFKTIGCITIEDIYKHIEKELFKLL